MDVTEDCNTSHTHTDYTNDMSGYSIAIKPNLLIVLLSTEDM